MRRAAWRAHFSRQHVEFRDPAKCALLLQISRGSLMVYKVFIFSHGGEFFLAPA